MHFSGGVSVAVDSPGSYPSPAIRVPRLKFEICTGEPGKRRCQPEGWTGKAKVVFWWCAAAQGVRQGEEWRDACYATNHSTVRHSLRIQLLCAILFMCVFVFPGIYFNGVLMSLFFIPQKMYIYPGYYYDCSNRKINTLSAKKNKKKSSKGKRCRVTPLLLILLLREHLAFFQYGIQVQDQHTIAMLLEARPHHYTNPVLIFAVSSYKAQHEQSRGPPTACVLLPSHLPPKRSEWYYQIPLP